MPRGGANNPNGNPAWKKGVSANPAGKPRGTRSKANQLLDKLAGSKARSVLKAVIAAAENGDISAAVLLLSRIWRIPSGRPIEIEGIPPIKTAADVLAAMARITEVAAAGDISPEEASAMSTVVEHNRRAIETLNLDTRLQALEERLRVQTLEPSSLVDRPLLVRPRFSFNEDSPNVQPATDNHQEASSAGADTSTEGHG